MRWLIVCLLWLPARVTAQDLLELKAVDAQLEVLKQAQRKKSLALPLALMGVGGAVFVLGSTAAYNPGYEGRHGDGAVANTVIAVGAVGAALVIPGLVMLVRRLSARRELETKIQLLRHRRRYLDWRLHYGMSPQHAGLSFALSGRF